LTVDIKDAAGRFGQEQHCATAGHGNTIFTQSVVELDDPSCRNGMHNSRLFMPSELFFGTRAQWLLQIQGLD